MSEFSIEYLVKVDDQVQLTDIAKIFVEYFNKSMDQFQNQELVVSLIDDSDEIKTGISLIDYLVVFVVYKVAHFGFSGNYELVNLSF